MNENAPDIARQKKKRRVFGAALFRVMRKNQTMCCSDWIRPRI